MLGLCSQANAHRLEAEYRILPGRKVAVESWFDLTGESPVGAAVSVYRQANGALLQAGTLDEKGLFVFSYARAEPLRVVVSAGGGHRKDLEIPAAELRQGETEAIEPGKDGSPSSSPQSASEGVKPFADRSPRISVKDVLLGAALLLAVAAFGLAMNNARKLRELRRQYRSRPDEGKTPPDA